MVASIAEDIGNFLHRLHRNDHLTEVEYQQINRIFSDTSPLGPVLFLLFGLAGMVLWEYVPRLWLVLFMFGFVSDVAIKIGIVEYYKRRSQSEQQSGTWRRVIFFGVMYTSGLWGASTLFLFYPMPVQNLVVGIGVFSIVLYIAITLSRSYLPVQTIGTCLSFLPMCIALMLSNIWQYQLLSGLLIFALCMTLMLFRNSAELAASLIKEQSRLDERSHIVRELHDGMGGHLMSAIALSEKEQGTPAIQAALRAALSEMRLLLSSVDGEPQNLLWVLGALRERIEPQIEHSGMRLVWDVASSDKMPELTVAEQLHVTRVVQECTANTIKHAEASVLTVKTETSGNAAHVLIIDDGVGVSSYRDSGHGLRNIHYRAAQLGGSFKITSAEGKTVARLSLPFRR